MEIHPPTKPIESVREFFVHLSMITIGILIALGLEQTVEAWHHHELGVRAEESILNEMRDNKKEIDAERTLVAKNKERLGDALGLVQQLLAHRKLLKAEISIRFSGADLSSTSWTTAAVTGALGYMGYSETKRFAHAYDLQALILPVQSEGLHETSRALALLAYAPGGPESLNDEQLRTTQSEILNCLAITEQWDQLAVQLSKQYARALKAD